MTSRWQGALDFRRYGRELAFETDAVSLKKRVWGGGRATAKRLFQSKLRVFNPRNKTMAEE